jgi:hypothetical protein
MGALLHGSACQGLRHGRMMLISGLVMVGRATLRLRANELASRRGELWIHGDYG